MAICIIYYSDIFIKIQDLVILLLLYKPRHSTIEECD